MSIVIVVIIGLVTGAVARLLMPSEARGAWRSCALLGVAGALAAYLLARLVGAHDASGDWLAMHGAAIGGLGTLATYRLLRPEP